MDIEVKKEETIIDESSSKLIKGISISTILNNIGLMIYFIAREIVVYNLLDKINASNYTIFLGLIDILTATVIIRPTVLPKIYQEIGKNEIHKCNKNAFLILVINYFITCSILFGLIFGGFKFNLSVDMNLIYLFFLLSLAFIAESIKYIFISIFYGIKKPKEAGLAKVIFASLLIFLLFYFDQRHILDFNISVLIFIFSNLIYLILSIYYYKKFIPKEKEEDKEGINNFYNSQISKRILKFGYPLFLSDIFILLNFKIGTVLLAGVSLNYSVYYHLSTSLIIYIVGIIGYPIKNNIQSYLAEFYEQNNLPQVKKTFFLIIQIIIFFLIPILITLYGLSPLFLKFLYSNYYSIDFINLFKIAIWGGSFYALNILLNNIIIAKGKTKMILFAQFFSSLFSITFIFIAIFLENILYAGIGFLGSNILSFMIFCVISKKYIHLTMKKMKFLPIVGFSFFSFIVFEIINIFLSNIFLSTVISLSMYIILILIFRIGSLGALKKIFKTLIE